MGAGRLRRRRSTSSTRRPASRSAPCRSRARPRRAAPSRPPTRPSRPGARPRRSSARKLLRKLHDAIMDNQEALAELLTIEQGKSLAEAKGEIGSSAAYVLWFAEEAPPHLWRRRAVAVGRPPHPRDQGAGRRHRRDHAVEFPVLDAGPQDRPGARRRLHRRRQAGLADALFGPRLGRAVPRKSASRRASSTS